MVKKLEFLISQSAVAPFMSDNWLRTEKCFIDGVDIVASGRANFYSPTSIGNLAVDFANTADAASALRFVTEYGPLDLPGSAAGIRLGLGPEPLEWRRPIEDILLQAKKVAGIRKSVASLADVRGKVRQNLSSTLVDLWGLKMPFSRDPKAAAKNLSDVKIVHTVREFILQELNDQLPRSSERARINVQGAFERVLFFNSLSAVIYRKLFEELERGRLRLCQECDKVFEWADPRQMYCSKRCGLNNAQRRYRDRQAE